MASASSGFCARPSSCSRELYEQLKARGVDVLLDDRDLSPGVKFKDADLIGVPFRVNVGKKLAEGKVEVVNRRTKESSDVAVTEAAALLAGLIAAAKQ
jgi:prolyl-tRNA synthetase